MAISEDKLVDLVSQILYDDWDPIGLRRLGVKNQYRRYALELVERYRSNPSEPEIVECMKGAFRRIFGRDADDWTITVNVAQHIFKLLSTM